MTQTLARSSLLVAALIASLFLLQAFSAYAAGENLTPSGPIVIDGQSDVTISGKKISNPNGTCVTIKRGSANITIENNEIGPCGDKGVEIVTDSTKVTVRNNYFHDIKDSAVYGYKTHHITVDGNRIETVRTAFEAWTVTQGHLVFTNNWVKNVGAYGEHGNLVLLPRGSGPGTRITNNIVINVLGESDPEDIINVYKSQGDPNDPILITNNKINGGGPSYSGGGIILGDGNGSYQTAENNILVNPGQYGIQIAGGHNNILRNNKVFSDDQRYFTNGGMIVWRYSQNGKGTAAGECYGHTVVNNEITFWKGPNYKNNGLPASRNGSWNPTYGEDNKSPNCGTVTGWSNNKVDTNGSQPANLNESLWDPAWSIAPAIPGVVDGGPAHSSGSGTTEPYSPGICNLYTPSVTTPTGYGASYNVFNQSELMLSIYCNEDKSVTVTAGNNDDLTYVYNQGYYYANNQWNNFTYTCTDETIADIWCTKQATKTLTNTPTTGTTYLVSYTCQWRNNTWNCGCHNSACTTNHWQLQAFKL